MWRDFWDDTGGKLVKFLWCAFLTLSLGKALFNGSLQKNAAVIADITWWLALQNLAVAIVVVSTAAGIIKSHPIFKWSWLSLFKSYGPNINIMLIPMFIKYFGLMFTLLFMVNLPSMAMNEERWFRAGTKDWLEGLSTSFLFGMAHCLMGVPIGACVAITLAGIWFTHQYFLGGVQLSALHHTTFNLILISALFFFLLLKHVRFLVENSERKTLRSMVRQ